MSDALDRRRFLRGGVLAGAAVSAATLAGCGRQLTEEERLDLAPAPAEPAAWWLSDSAPAGSHALLELPYKYDALVIQDKANPDIKGISEQVVTWHHDKHHGGYVKALNKIETDLAAMESYEANANYSIFTELKRRETFNASGMYLHEIYWLNMTPGGSVINEQMGIYAKLCADFGSYEAWEAEFIATAKTPNTGWAIAALSPYDWKIHNYACSFHDLGGVWGALPLICCDVWEHAYYWDYGPDRASYITSFLRLLNWAGIEQNFRRWGAAVQGMVG